MCRFFPDGTFLSCTSPLPVKLVGKLMSRPKPHYERGGDLQHNIFLGKYYIKNTRVWAVVRFPNQWSTEIRFLFNLRSTHVGANNRWGLAHDY